MAYEENADPIMLLGVPDTKSYMYNGISILLLDRNQSGLGKKKSNRILLERKSQYIYRLIFLLGKEFLTFAKGVLNIFYL